MITLKENRELLDTCTDGIIIDISHMSSNAFHINLLKIKRIAAAVCHHLGLADFELSLNFVSAEEMRELNHSYRYKDRSTDVLSFPQLSWHTPLSSGSLEADKLDSLLAERPVGGTVLLLGDIVISLADALENARKIGHDVDREACFLIVHGLLHLCGHDHMEPSEEERMLAEQQKIMTLLADMENPPLWRQCVELKDGQG